MKGAEDQSMFAVEGWDENEAEGRENRKRRNRDGREGFMYGRNG